MIGYTERNYDGWLEAPYVEAARESEMHEAYQESNQFFSDVSDWVEENWNAISDLFIASNDYADRFEEWRERE